MNDENSFWIKFWAMILSFLLITIISCMAIHTCHIQKMAKLGYEEKPIPGTANSVWVKSNS